MNILLATTDAQIKRCYFVMRQLRPQYGEQEFIDRVRMQQQLGYLLAYAQEDTAVLVVAGFRISQNLSWGRFLYVDDLVTLETHRSRGYGAKMLAWLKTYAIDNNCEQLHLDSGFQRKEAHRFYEREEIEATGLHFRWLKTLDTANGKGEK